MCVYCFSGRSTGKRRWNWGRFWEASQFQIMQYPDAMMHGHDRWHCDSEKNILVCIVVIGPGIFKSKNDCRDKIKSAVVSQRHWEIVISTTVNFAFQKDFVLRNKHLSISVCGWNNSYFLYIHSQMAAAFFLLIVPCLFIIAEQNLQIAALWAVIICVVPNWIGLQIFCCLLGL